MYSGPELNFVASFPKAGTHLIAWILGELGLIDTKWQIGYDSTNLTDVNDGKLLGVNLPRDTLTGDIRLISIDRNQVLRLVKAGQFAVGHLPPHVIDPELHFRMKTVLLIREIRSALLSYYNFYKLLAFEDPHFSRFAHIEDPTVQMEQFLEASMKDLTILWRDLMAWKLYRSNLIVTYENLTSETYRSNTISRIAAHFSLDASESKIDQVSRRYGQSSTPTKLSLSKELRPGQWSVRCEELYEHYGCAALDKEISGYIETGY